MSVGSDPLNVYVRKMFVVKGSAVSLVLVLMGVFFVLRGLDHAYFLAVLGLLMIPLGIFLFVFCLAKLFRPILVVHSEGILDSSPRGAGFIPWQEISEVITFVYEGSSYLGIVPKNLPALHSRQGMVKSSLHQLESTLGRKAGDAIAAQDIPRIWQEFLSKPVDELAREINRYWEGIKKLSAATAAPSLPPAVPSESGQPLEVEVPTSVRSALGLPEPPTPAVSEERAPNVEPRLAELIQKLSEGGFNERRSAVEALGRMGAEGQEAVPALIEKLQGPEEPIRWRAADALGNIGSPDAVQALSAALQDFDAMVRLSAAKALGKLGPKAKTALAALRVALQDNNALVRKEAAAAIHNIE